MSGHGRAVPQGGINRLVGQVNAGALSAPFYQQQIDKSIDALLADLGYEEEEELEENENDNAAAAAHAHDDWGGADVHMHDDDAEEVDAAQLMPLMAGLAIAVMDKTEVRQHWGKGELCLAHLIGCIYLINRVHLFN